MALDAIEMIVLWVTIIVFIHASTIEFKAAKQPCVDEFVESPVNRGAAYVILLPLSRQLVDQLIGIEVLVSTKNLFHQKASLLRFSQTSTAQILLKPLIGGL